MSLNAEILHLPDDLIYFHGDEPFAKKLQQTPFMLIYTSEPVEFNLLDAYTLKEKISKSFDEIQLIASELKQVCSREYLCQQFVQDLTREIQKYKEWPVDITNRITHISPHDPYVKIHNTLNEIYDDCLEKSYYVIMDFLNPFEDRLSKIFFQTQQLDSSFSRLEKKYLKSISDFNKIQDITDISETDSTYVFLKQITHNLKEINQNFCCLDTINLSIYKLEKSIKSFTKAHYLANKDYPIYLQANEPTDLKPLHEWLESKKVEVLQKKYLLSSFPPEKRGLNPKLMDQLSESCFKETIIRSDEITLSEFDRFFSLIDPIQSKKIQSKYDWLNLQLPSEIPDIWINIREEQFASIKHKSSKNIFTRIKDIFSSILTTEPLTFEDEHIFATDF